jgi:transcriptional regulator with XRE-family HTH domain
MTAATRAIDRAARLTTRTLFELADEFRERRLALGESQAHVAEACQVSRPYYGRIENGAARSLTIADAHRVATVLGLSASIRVFPGGVPVRDVAHASRLAKFLGWAHPPSATAWRSRSRSSRAERNGAHGTR